MSDWAEYDAHAIYQFNCLYGLTDKEWEDTMADALRKVRRDTLEEAAKCAELYNKDGPDRVSTIARQINIATAIRNLNTMGTLGETAEQIKAEKP